MIELSKLLHQLFIKSKKSLLKFASKFNTKDSYRKQDYINLIQVDDNKVKLPNFD